MTLYYFNAAIKKGTDINAKNVRESETSAASDTIGTDFSVLDSSSTDPRFFFVQGRSVAGQLRLSLHKRLRYGSHLLCQFGGQAYPAATS
jgi:hypothetical protein